MWLYALLIYSDLVTGISTNALRRHLGIGRIAAWTLSDKIRTHIALPLAFEPLGGPGRKVYIDETLLAVGSRKEKIILFGMTDGLRAEIRIVPNRKAATLIPLICEAVRPGSKIVTDGLSAYNSIRRYGYIHSRVIHRRMWVNEDGDSTTYIEGLWAVTKRLLSGRTMNIAQGNVWKFIAEVMHRYNGRLDPAESYWRLIGKFRPIGESEVERARRWIDRRAI